MGLGPFPAVTLARAREMRDEWAAVRAEGHDPIDVRDRRKRAARAGFLSLAEATEKAFEARRAELRDDGGAGRWLSPVRIHVLPKLGRRAVDQLDPIELADVLRGFDVCILPHVVNELRRNANPLKVWEYLATGKPFVSVDLPALAPAGSLIRVAKTHDQFLTHVENALASGQQPETSLERQDVARRYSWNRLSLDLLEHLYPTVGC